MGRAGKAPPYGDTESARSTHAGTRPPVPTPTPNPPTLSKPPTSAHHDGATKSHRPPAVVGAIVMLQRNNPELFDPHARASIPEHVRVVQDRPASSADQEARVAALADFAAHDGHGPAGLGHHPRPPRAVQTAPLQEQDGVRPDGVQRRVALTRVLVVHVARGQLAARRQGTSDVRYSIFDVRSATSTSDKR